jgi:hypothetical protein
MLCVHIESVAGMLSFRHTRKAFAVSERRLIAIILSLFAFAVVDLSEASEMPWGGKERAISIEYLAPGKRSRDIKTTNVDISYLFAEVEDWTLSLYAGLTATHAAGNIKQLEGSLAQGNLRQVQHDSAAFGLGPGISARLRLWSSDEFSINLNGAGSLLVYEREFPPGGDHYNFMWRAGPSLEYEIGESKSIGVGLNWAHISNGQGSGPQNPSYDAQDVVLGFTGFF